MIKWNVTTIASRLNNLRENLITTRRRFSQDNLLLINHAKLMYQKSWNGGKEYMVSALFRYLDLDGNGFLQIDELDKVNIK